MKKQIKDIRDFQEKLAEVEENIVFNEYEKNNHLLINAFYDVHVFCNSICIRFFGQRRSGDRH